MSVTPFHPLGMTQPLGYDFPSHGGSLYPPSGTIPTPPPHHWMKRPFSWPLPQCSGGTVVVMKGSDLWSLQSPVSSGLAAHQRGSHPELCLHACGPFVHEIFHGNNPNPAPPPTVYLTCDVIRISPSVSQAVEQVPEEIHFFPSLIPAFGHSTNAC